MPSNNLLREIHNVLFDFRMTRNGIRARQQLSAMRTNAIRMGKIDDAEFINRLMRGFR